MTTPTATPEIAVPKTTQQETVPLADVAKVGDLVVYRVDPELTAHDMDMIRDGAAQVAEASGVTVAVVHGDVELFRQDAAADLMRLRGRMDLVAWWADRYDGEIAGAIREALDLTQPHWSDDDADSGTKEARP